MFCGKDVAMSLGYKRPADAISAHCKGVCKLQTPKAGGVQKMKFISEGDIYRYVDKDESLKQGLIDRMEETTNELDLYGLIISSKLPNSVIN